MKPIPLYLTVAAIVLQSCSNIGTGFAGYEKPSKRSNKYYDKHFKLTNTQLQVGKRYTDLVNKGLHANNQDEYSSFVFFENGFVIHNPNYISTSATLNYSTIHSEEVGSYLISGDTIYWDTRAGYQKKRMTQSYTALITDSGLKVINAPGDKEQFFRVY